MKHNHFWKLYWLGALILLVTLACRSVVPGGGGASGAASGENPTVTVTTDDFDIRMDASQAGAGTVTFVVLNKGHMPHDFAINGSGVEEKTPMIDPGEEATLVVELEPGSYDYVCTVPGHAMLGMRGTFRVTE